MNILSKCRLDNLGRNTTIKQRVWFGFGLILVILAVVSVSTLSQFNSLSTGINKVTEKIQPAVLSAQNLAFQLESTNSSLALYMLTREDSYIEKYDQSMQEANLVLQALQSEEYISSNKNYLVAVETIAEHIGKLASYKNRIVELVSNDAMNIPAMAIAGEKLNPMARSIQGMISQMIVSEWDEDNSEEARSEFRQALYNTRYYNAQLIGELRTFLAFRTEVNITNMSAMNEVLDAKSSFISNSEDLLTFEQADLFPEYLKIRKDYMEALNQTIAIHSTDKYRNDIYLTKNEIGPIIVDSQKELVNLVEQLRDDVAKENAALQRATDTASSNVIMGMSLGIFIGIIIAFFIERMITLPIGEAVLAIEDLAAGEGDLTRRLRSDGKSELTQMSDGFNRFTEKVHNLVTEVAQGVENLSLVAKDVSTIVDQTQRGSQQQRMQTEHVATAITGMTSMMHEVASNANLAANSAQEADEKAKTGLSVVTDTIGSINELSVEIDAGANVIKELEKETESIGSVLDVIKSIAEQTNLLALNAAIEAARAGEQGRGFAVVADEVRTLASRTQKSTEEIQGMINNLQSRAHAAVKTITQGQEKTKISVSKATNAGEALQAITKSVDTITSMNIQIAKASDEQKSVTEKLNHNVTDISQVADENASASGKLAASSTDLAKLATDLRYLVSQFKY